MTQVNGLDPRSWKYRSSADEGLHSVVAPDNSICLGVWIFRLNIDAGASWKIEQDALELSAVVIAGSMILEHATGHHVLERFDSFYLPPGDTIRLSAQKDLFVYIGGARYDGIGEFMVRKFDLSLPLGAVHQIHGRPPYEREVFMTLDPDTPASRLITGLTWGRDGAWTSWPPHQHEKHLEEVYCYFDLDSPKFGLHLSYRKADQPEVAHIVSSGDCVIAPRGYHPTVAIPGMVNSYLWVLAAHSHKSRRYDLAMEDPHYVP